MTNSFIKTCLKWKALWRVSLVLSLLLLLYNSLTFTLLTDVGQVQNISSPGIPDRISNKMLQKKIQDNVNTTQIGPSKESIDHWISWNIPMDNWKTQGDLQYTQFTMKPFLRKSSNIVCLSTQTTINRILEVVEVANNWRGIMSVSVYVSGLDFTKAKIILWLLHKCFEPLASEVVFHFAFSRNNLPINDPELWNNITMETCKSVREVGDILDVTKEYSLYPQNTMRNIAREECDSEYVILSDNDMIPTPGLSAVLLPLLVQQRSCEKCAFVIPAYEFNNEIKTLPTKKDELLQMVQRKEARPFHWKKWQRNQLSHDPQRWEHHISSQQGIGIAYRIDTFQLTYEPLYVARKPLPVFDNRFVGYGFTRSSQVFEMVAAGYTLYLLDNVFMMHRGTTPSKYSLNFVRREQENTHNSGHFTKFAKEVLTRYGRMDLVQEMDKGFPQAVLYKYAQNIYDFHRNTAT